MKLMFKILVVVERIISAGGIHSNIIEFNTEEEALKAYAILENSSAGTRSRISQVVKLF